MTSDDARALPTLGARLARHVLVPLAVVWLLGTAFAIGLAMMLTESSFDRSLLDDALGLAASVTKEDGQLRVDLGSAELKALLYDQTETHHFAVRTPDGRLVAGDPAVVARRPGPQRSFEFVDIAYETQTLRAVVLHREQPAPFDLVLAQTTGDRAALSRLLLLYSVLPQALLLLLLGGWLRRAIAADVRPIVALQDELNRRGPSDLQPLAVAATTRDVATLAHATDALMTRLSHAIRAQREFSGNLAHELRTPLAGIRALAEFGLASRDPAVWREQLQRIVGSEDRASHLVDQLLALALADEAGVAPTPADVALDDLVRRVLLQALPRADAAGVDLGAQGIDERVVVCGDAGLLEGALGNLVDNALRHGRPRDGTPPRVTVEVTRRGARVVLAVVDNGPGIDEAEHTRLTGRWQQGVDGLRLGGGAGLGLYIVARYAGLLGADLTIGGGTDGRGARVALALPERPADSPVNAP